MTSRLASKSAAKELHEGITAHTEVERAAYLTLHPLAVISYSDTPKISLREEGAVADKVEESIIKEALPVVQHVANLELGKSPESITEFKKWIVAHGKGVYGVFDKDREWLLKFRDQLRKIWSLSSVVSYSTSLYEEKWAKFERAEWNKRNVDRGFRDVSTRQATDTGEVQEILTEWLFPESKSDPQRFVLDLSNWWVFQNSGKFVPKQHNIKAIAGRIVIHNSHYLLGGCSECGRLFVGDRRIQKLCLSETCKRARNALANKELRARQAIARRATKRKGKA